MRVKAWTDKEAYWLASEDGVTIEDLPLESLAAAINEYSWIGVVPWGYDEGADLSRELVIRAEEIKGLEKLPDDIEEPTPSQP